MTIYTPSQGEKKSDKDYTDPEVVTEPLVDQEDESTSTIVTAKALRVSYFQRNQRNFFLHLLITLMVLVILTAGAIGAVIFYRHLNKRVYAGRCGNVFFDKTYHDKSDMLIAEPLAVEHKDDFVEEGIIVSDIDMYEQLYTPEFDEVRENHVWHDFVRNYTAIVDNSWEICYVMKLNRTAIAPPRDVIDFLNKLISGYYVPSAEVIRENYIVITPPLKDLAPLGQKIVENCAEYDTYWLDKYVSGVSKRSVDSVDSIVTYAMFSNFRDHQELYKLDVHNAQKNV